MIDILTPDEFQTYLYAAKEARFKQDVEVWSEKIMQNLKCLWQQEFKRPFNIGLSDKLGEEYYHFVRNKRLFETVVSIFQEKGWRLYIRTDSNMSQVLLLDEIVPSPQSPYRG